MCGGGDSIMAGTSCLNPSSRTISVPSISSFAGKHIPNWKTTRVLVQRLLHWHQAQHPNLVRDLQRSCFRQRSCVDVSSNCCSSAADAAESTSACASDYKYDDDDDDDDDDMLVDDTCVLNPTQFWQASEASQLKWNSSPVLSLGEADNVRGWVLGLAMALFVFSPSESHGAMQMPRGAVPIVSSRVEGYDPISKEQREASAAFSRRVSEALDLLDKARKAQARDDFSGALQAYNLIAQNNGDLALAEYARVGRAVNLYEVGDRAQAILEMEDMSLSLTGYPEVHAALAAALYADKHATVPAEQQFTIATLLDSRYTDPSWVKSAKHWPPSLIASLQKFIALR